MSTANERQEGGTHYKKHQYEHWDYVCDTGMHYLLACATKYASRWRDKNGDLDLKKLIHYLDKADERGIRPPEMNVALLDRFCEQLEPSDRLMVRLIMLGAYDAAREIARDLMSSET